MDPKYLSADEIEIECSVREIVGTVVEQMASLTEILKKEKDSNAVSILKSHMSARKAPQRELDSCSKKLRDLKPQVKEIAELEVDQRQGKLKVLSTRILHVSGRFERLINTSPSCRIQAQHMVEACDKVLHVIESLLLSQLDIGEFEKSVCAAIPSKIGIGTEHTESDITESEGETSHNNTIHRGPNQPNNISQLLGKVQLPGPSSDVNSMNTHFTRPKQEKQTALPKVTNSKHISEAEYAQFISLARKISIAEELQSNKKNTGKANISTPEIPRLAPRSNERLSGQNIGLNKWNIFFDGSTTGLPIERFIYRVERLAWANNISSGRLVDGLHLLLKNPALEWYWSLLERNGNVEWVELKDDMLEMFKDRRSDAEIKQTIASRKQLPKESFKDFYMDISEQTMALRKPLSESDLEFILRRNMRSTLQYKLAGRRFGSISELVNQCVEIEDTWKRLATDPTYPRRSINEFTHLNPDQNCSEGISTPYNPSSFSPANPIGDYNPYGSNEVYSLNMPNQVPEIPARNKYGSSARSNPNMYEKSDSRSNPNRQTQQGPNWTRYCFGCGTPNVIRPNCYTCNGPPPGNQKRELSCPGAQPSQMINPTRILTSEAASNTCPELRQRQA